MCQFLSKRLVTIATSHMILVMKMLDIAWFAKEASPSNTMAVPKRRTFLYVRPSIESPGPAMRLPLDDKTDLLHSESRILYDFYRKGGVDLPRDFQQKVEWEMHWLNLAMTGLTHAEHICSVAAMSDGTRTPESESNFEYNSQFWERFDLYT